MTSSQLIRMAYQGPKTGPKPETLVVAPRTRFEKCSRLVATKLATTPRDADQIPIVVLTKGVKAAAEHVVTQIANFGDSPKFFISVRGKSLEETIMIWFAGKVLELKASVLDKLQVNLQKRLAFKGLKVTPALLKTTHLVLGQYKTEQILGAIHSTVIAKAARGSANGTYNESESAELEETVSAFPTLKDDFETELSAAIASKEAYEERVRRREVRAKQEEKREKRSKYQKEEEKKVWQMANHEIPLEDGYFAKVANLRRTLKK